MQHPAGLGPPSTTSRPKCPPFVRQRVGHRIGGGRDRNVRPCGLPPHLDLPGGVDHAARRFRRRVPSRRKAHHRDTRCWPPSPPRHRRSAAACTVESSASWSWNAAPPIANTLRTGTSTSQSSRSSAWMPAVISMPPPVLVVRCHGRRLGSIHSFTIAEDPNRTAPNSRFSSSALASRMDAAKRWVCPTMSGTPATCAALRDRVATGQRRRHGLLEQDRLPCLGGGDRQFFVRMMRRRNHHGRHRGSASNSAASGYALPPYSRRERIEPRRIVTACADEMHAVHAPDRIGMALAEPARADDSDTQACILRSWSCGHPVARRR